MRIRNILLMIFEVISIIFCTHFKRRLVFLCVYLLKTRRKKGKEMSRIRMQQKTNETIRQGFANFISRKSYENVSPNTIKTYSLHFEVFMNFINNDEMLMQEVDDKTIGNFIIHLRTQRECKDATIKSYVGTLRAFFYNCMDNGEIEPFRIKMPKCKTTAKECYSKEELQILIKKPESNSFVEYRTWFYINLLYGTGMRLESALLLKIKDVNFNGQTITLYNTKSRINQTIQIDSALLRIVKEYLSVRKGEAEDYLFCDDCGNPIKKRTLQDALARYNRSRGIEKTSSHLFRHTFSTAYIGATGNIIDLQRRLGHKSSTTTENYIRTYVPDFNENFDEISPLASLYGSKNKNNKIEMKEHRRRA